MWQNKLMICRRIGFKLVTDKLFDTAAEAQYFIELNGLFKFGSDKLADFVLVPAMSYEIYG